MRYAALGNSLEPRVAIAQERVELCICYGCQGDELRVCGCLLGNIDESPSKEPMQSDLSPSNKSPSNTRRRKGEGSGSIHWKTITRNGRNYPQAWYHYEFWSEGDRLIKSTKYIPKNLLPEVQRLNHEKARVREILRLLGVTGIE